MVKKDEFELVDSCDDQDFETGHIDFEYTLKTVHLTETAGEKKKRRTTLRVRVKSRVQNDEDAAANRAYAQMEQLMEKAFEQGFIRGLKYASERQSSVPRISFDEH